MSYGSDLSRQRTVHLGLGGGFGMRSPTSRLALWSAPVTSRICRVEEPLMRIYLELYFDAD